MSITDYDLNAMRAAREEAEKAGSRDEVPIGAVLVDRRTGAIVARDGNRTRELNDPSAHAEIMVIRAVGHIESAQRLPDYDLYVTLEPCTMCTAAVSFARINRVIFGASDPKGGGILHGAKFYEQPTCHHKPQVMGPVMPECGDILKAFFSDRR
jgi:tRNA(adenine34) deaminase